MKQPYVMQLEQVCKGIEQKRTMLLEINPNYPDIDIYEKMRLVKLNLDSGRFVGFRSPYAKPVTTNLDNKKHEVYSIHSRIKLTTYGTTWRCWAGGIPTDEQILSTKWRKTDDQFN